MNLNKHKKMKTCLYAGILDRVMNVLATATVSITKNILDWTLEELRVMNRQTIKLKAVDKGLHSKLVDT